MRHGGRRSCCWRVPRAASARTDRQKRLRYQRTGVPHYWMVDPGQLQIEVWHPESEAGEVWQERSIWFV